MLSLIVLFSGAYSWGGSLGASPLCISGQCDCLDSSEEALFVQRERTVSFSDNCEALIHFFA